MSFDIDSRMRAIATNAIREARIAKQIDVGPWLDDHAQRLDLIFKVLKDIAITYAQEVEHYPLTVDSAPPLDPRLEKLSSIMDDLDVEIKPIESVIPKAKKVSSTYNHQPE